MLLHSLTAKFGTQDRSPLAGFKAGLTLRAPAAFHQLGPMAQQLAEPAALDGRQIVEILGFQGPE